MAKSIDIGVNGIARNITALYIGVNGVARKVTKGYIGVNGVAREFYQSIIPITITAKNQTITYGNSIATGTSQATVSGLPSGYTFSSITLSQSTTSATTSGTITPSAAVIKDSGNVDVTNKFAITYVNGSLVINKANPSYTAPTAKSGLTYNGTTNTNGTAQALANAGSTSHGTIYYSINNSTWSTSVPTSTNAGSTTVYWKLTGDSNHTDVASISLGSISIARKGITRVTGQTTSFTYNGSSQSVVVNNYDSNTITRGGTYSAFAVGNYTATYTPMSNFQWNSGSDVTSAISIGWSINKQTVGITLSASPTSISLNSRTARAAAMTISISLTNTAFSVDNITATAASSNTSVVSTGNVTKAQTGIRTGTAKTNAIYNKRGSATITWTITYSTAEYYGSATITIPVTCGN